SLSRLHSAEAHIGRASPEESTAQAHRSHSTRMFAQALAERVSRHERNFPKCRRRENAAGVIHIHCSFGYFGRGAILDWRGPKADRLRNREPQAAERCIRKRASEMTTRKNRLRSRLSGNARDSQKR